MKKLFASIIAMVLIASALCFSGCFRPDDSYKTEDAGYFPGYEAVVGEGGYGYGRIDGGYGGYGGKDALADYPATDAAHGGAGEAPGGTATETDTQNSQIPYGKITASAWDDNKYYDYFLTLFSEGEIGGVQDAYPYMPVDDGAYGTDAEEGDADPVVGAAEEPSEGTTTAKAAGKLYHFYKNDRWGFDATKRVTVNVKSGDNAVAGATVSYYGADQRERFAVTDANGVAYIFPDGDGGTVTVKSGDYTAQGAFTAEDRELTIALGGAVQKDSVIKLMLVVDVTGSMGDELDYLKAELKNVIRRVANANEGVRIDLAMLFYRDDCDREEFVYFDFSTVTDNDENLTAQIANLSSQFAEGGGDYPEALDIALLMAADADWGNENSTKIIFNIYDAPPHETDKNKATYESAVRLAAKKGIRINPVLCSGAGTLCEYLARETAIHTQGNFVYVTDDSGIGNSHYDPDIPNAVVELFNDLMIRLINGYYTGTFAEPVSWKATGTGKFYYLAAYDPNELVIYFPAKAEVGSTVEIKTQVLTDVDIIVSVDGVAVERTHYGSDYWGYTFVMPDHEVLIGVSLKGADDTEVTVG